MLRVRDLRKEYSELRWLSRRSHSHVALDGVDLEIPGGATLALVGESGAGKSTLARLAVGLEKPTSGAVWIDGREWTALSRRQLRPLRRQAQLIFQDPAGSLNPRFSAAEIVAEPLEIQQEGTREERRRRALEMMERVGLPRNAADRRPEQFSGGQRQRLALARALALEPKLLILDESFSGLDLSVQAQMLNLLMEVQERYSLTCLYISHDLELAASIAGEIAVMHRGTIVERAQAGELMRNPKHAHTKALVAAAAIG